MSDFETRIKRLSAEQMDLLARRVSSENETKPDYQENKRLVAYLMAEESINTGNLRELLRDKLPEYMIPAKFVQLEEFPKLPNGKIDINSLEDPFAKESEYSPTDTSDHKTNEVETKLVKIWEDVLKFSPVGVDDNFFEIGGDSILSIQIVAKARKHGIILAPNQLFENQTISELARLEQPETEEKDEENAGGIAPLLPIQHWFFEEHENAPHHWNQAMIFESDVRLDPDLLQSSVRRLLQQHEALRLKFVREGGEWFSSVRDVDRINPFQSIDLSGVPENELEKTINSKSVEMQSDLSLSKSALFQTVLFDYSKKEKGSRILLFAHHLIVDSISWGILIEDLETIYRQLENGDEVSLSSRSSSYKRWGEYLVGLADSDELDTEIEFWRNQKVDSDTFPTDFEKELPYVLESVKTLDSVLDRETTVNLLANSERAYNTKTDAILLTALMLALEKCFGVDEICVGFENHGREHIGSGLDLSNSVGWFTSYCPIKLVVDDPDDLNSCIIAVKETLRSVPNKGLGYGVLRYLKSESGLDQTPSIIFNYLGQKESVNSDVFGKGDWIVQGAYSERSERHNIIGLNAFMRDKKLQTMFDFSGDMFKTESIKDLIAEFENQLRKIEKHCGDQESIKYSPSDFAEADLDQADLDSVLNQI